MRRWLSSLLIAALASAIAGASVGRRAARHPDAVACSETTGGASREPREIRDAGDAPAAGETGETTPARPSPLRAPAPAYTGRAATRALQAPGLVDVRRMRFEIVEARFVERLEAESSEFLEQDAESYRGLVLTVKIEKPAGTVVTLHAFDVTLHYRHGGESDVASCRGLSGFSRHPDEDRPMHLYDEGYCKRSTREMATAAAVVYVDCFFVNMEQNTRDLHLLIAQPVSEGFMTAGWGVEKNAS